MRYPILNFGSYEDHGSVYGPLADFLFQQSKMRARSQYYSRPEHLVSFQEATIPDYMDETHASILYTETVGCLLAFLSLSDKPHRSVVFNYGSDARQDNRLNSKITVVPLDQFYPKEISMPDQAQDAHHSSIKNANLLRELLLHVCASDTFCCICTFRSAESLSPK